MTRFIRRKLSVVLSSLLLIPFAFGYSSPLSKVKRKASVLISARKHAVGKKSSTVELNAHQQVSTYESLELAKLGLSKEAFDYAMKGREYLAANGKLQNQDILSIVDFSLPSSKKGCLLLI